MLPQSGRVKSPPSSLCVMHLWELFFTVLFGVSLHRLFGVPSGMNHVAPGCVSMVCRLLVMSGLMMLSCGAPQLSLTYDFLRLGRLAWVRKIARAVRQSCSKLLTLPD